MGGVVVPIAVAIGFPLSSVVANRPPSVLSIVGASCIVASGGVGLLDDGMKIFQERNVGLRELQKTILQVFVSLAFALAILNSATSCKQLSAVKCSQPLLHLSPIVYVSLVMVVFWGMTNAVNFTDGLEGLLAGSATTTFGALGGIGFWIFRHPQIYQRPDALDFSILAVCMAGAACGLLWWNISPRTIFMGDTGSLAFGAGLVVICSGLGITVLVPLVGALYVGVGASSLLQRVWFKISRRFGAPRRLFRMAPIHHHFELVGWAESTIVVRFWIFNAAAALAAVLVIYATAVRQLD